MQAVLDTNVVVARYVTPAGAPAQVLSVWNRRLFGLIVSEPILEEYGRVLAYGAIRQRHGMTDAEIATVVADFREFGVTVAPREQLRIVLAHPADDKFIACAVAGGADYIVSGGDDLLALRAYRGIRVVTPRLFLSLLPSV